MTIKNKLGINKSGINKSGNNKLGTGILGTVVVVAFAQNVQANPAEQFISPEIFLEDGHTNPSIGSTPDGRIRFEIQGGYAIAQGDIVLGDAKALTLNSGTILNRGLARNSNWDRWIDGLVHYKLDPSLDSEIIDKINVAIDHWNTRSSLTLIELTPELESPVDDYINFEAASGCASYVGRQGGEQALWVGSQCTAGSVIHEIGHAVGLFHEHTRADRDNYVSVEWDNIASGKQLNFDIFDTGVDLIGDYDYGSIMHYGSAFFSSSGDPTIITPDGINIGQRDALSQGDLATIDQIYATDLSLKTTQTTDEEGKLSLDVVVSNEGQLGAHDLVFTLPLGETENTIEMVASDWVCEILGDQLVCSYPSLAEQQSVTLNLFFDDASTISSEIAYLRSKTFDLDLSSNGAVPAESSSPKVTDSIDESVIPNSEPSIEAPALGSANSAQSSGGGGAVSWLVLLLPYMRRRSIRISHQYLANSLAP